MFRLSIDTLHKAFLAKAVSPVDVCHVFLKRIKRFKPLNAFITVADDTALLLAAGKSADRYARGTPLSRIDGIPFSVKDNFCTLNMRTTCASRTLESFVPPYSATVVERCLQNGALLIGKTNMDEFGMGSSSLESRFGAVYNPFNRFLRGLSSPSSSPVNHDDTSFSMLRAWINSELGTHKTEHVDDLTVDENLAYIAGGSSGGSAVSVATQTCVFALATDTGGSARNPAAHCGVAALKPSYGSLSRHGLVALMTAFDTPSIIACNVDDLNVVYGLLSGFDTHDATSGVCWPTEKLQSPLRVGVPTQFVVPSMSNDVRAAWQSALDFIEDSKHAHLLNCDVPHLPLAANCYLVIMCCEVASNFARYDGVRYGHRASRVPQELDEKSARKSDDFDSFEQQLVATRGQAFGDTVKGRVVAGNYFLLRENATRFYEQARKVNRLILNDFERAFEHCDVMLTPTTAHPAPLVTHYRRSASSHTDQTAKILSEDVCTVSANLCGLPAVSIPVALSKETRLPISVQLIGKRGHEQTVLQLAAFLEQKFRFDRLIAETRTK